jgi:hypothetical protein
MNDPELISDTRFSACDSGRAGASVVTAWDAPVMASGGQGVVLAVLQAGARSGVPVGLVVWQEVGMAADAQ